MDKVNRLIELGELLKSGTITQQEFETLKSEILNPIEFNDTSNAKEIGRLKELFVNRKITLADLDRLFELEGIVQSEYSIRKSQLTKPKVTSVKEISIPKNKQGVQIKRPVKKVKKENKGGSLKVVLILAVLLIPILIKFGKNSKNRSIIQETDTRYQQNLNTHKQVRKEVQHRCIECNLTSKESSMLHSTGDALSFENEYWICKGISNNMRCINNRYRKNLKYKRMNRRY